jgi:DNA topoisomerase-2
MTTEYQKLDPISHIHKRPDMYIGSLKAREQSREWVLGDDNKITEKENIKYSDGLVRIFVEALSNAIDNAWRSRKAGVKMTKIKVTMNEETGETSIWNDGLHIPVEMHPTEKIYNPDLIFGHLLTGSNMDDTEQRLSSGRNGLGIKLLNVFSKEFSVEVLDPVNHLLYKQTWKNNMREQSKPSIRANQGKNGYTLVRWVPDFEKFGAPNYDALTIQLYKKFVMDASMITQLPVYINDVKHQFKNFGDYVRLYCPGEEKPEMLVVEVDHGMGDDYKTSVCILQHPSQEYREVGFVNGVYTRDGGVHCDAVANELFRNLAPKFTKGNITAKDLRPYFMVFVNTWLPNPEFSSQSKTKLLSPPLSFKLEAKHVQHMMKWSFVEKIHDLIKDKEFLSLKKTEKKARGYKRIEGLDPANFAGTKHAKECTLILCEGLSAKTYATNGINVGCGGKKGRNYFGIYPLRGKCLNVRNATIKSISENKEIADVIQALGLKYGTDYLDDANFESLRYGGVLIITDADEDGHHISSLIINFFHKLFPSLLDRQPCFLRSMMTPIAKIFYTPTRVETFYNDFDYQNALTVIKQQEKPMRVRVKYYKGLGTSSDQEVRDTFGQKVVALVKDGTTDEMMDRLFHKNSSHERKEWLTTYDSSRYQTPVDEYPLTQYFNQELIKFSIEDCRRSIPTLFDGLKVSHRKILYSVFKKNLAPTGKSMKVAQLAGYCAEHSNYHHGEQCLHDTIIKMTHNFAGSNNVPFLSRDGQFGSRAYGGKDAANARYIFTKLAPLTRLLFPAADDHLLNYTLDDGDRVEPDFYVPIVPTILGNGCVAGIGTGWSCSVPCFDFVRLCDKVLEWLKDAENFEMDLEPYYHGFQGTMEKVGPNKYLSSGILRPYTPGGRSKKTNLWEIVELPIQTWTNKYKEELEMMVEQKKLQGLQNFSTPDTVHFVIEPSEGFVPTLDSMKLRSTILMTNMVLFVEDQKLEKFETLKDIFKVYAKKRLGLYTLRKAYLLKELRIELLLLKNKHRFLEEVQSQVLKVFRIPEKEVVATLQKTKYDKDPRATVRVDIESSHLHLGDEDESVDAVETGPEGEAKEASKEVQLQHGYNYLLRVPMRDFTQEKVVELDAKIKKKTTELMELEKTTEAQMWEGEIEAFLKEYRKIYTTPVV